MHPYTRTVNACLNQYISTLTFITDLPKLLIHTYVLSASRRIVTVARARLDSRALTEGAGLSLRVPQVLKRILLKTVRLWHQYRGYPKVHNSVAFT